MDATAVALDAAADGCFPFVTNETCPAAELLRIYKAQPHIERRQRLPISRTGTRGAMTTISALPSAWAALDAALRARRPVWISYRGRRRLICPHALGWRNRRPMVLGYQIGGETSTGALDADPRKRWRCMYVDEIDHVAAADPADTWATADNYNRSRPFPAVEELVMAVSAGPPQQAS